MALPCCTAATPNRHYAGRLERLGQPSVCIAGRGQETPEGDDDLGRHIGAPGRLKLEITETVLLCDPYRVRNIVAALRELGMHIILDDFGVGHASIAYLRDCAFDGLKIDRSFTAGIETDPRSRAFVRAIIEMARALGIGATGKGWRRRVSSRCCATKGSRPFRATCLAAR